MSNCSMSKQTVTDGGGVLTFMSCRPFSDAKTSLLYYQVFFSGRTIDLCFESLSRDVLHPLQVCFENIYYAFAEKPDNFFWT